MGVVKAISKAYDRVDDAFSDAVCSVAVQWMKFRLEKPKTSKIVGGAVVYGSVALGVWLMTLGAISFEGIEHIMVETAAALCVMETTGPVFTAIQFIKDTVEKILKPFEPKPKKDKTEKKSRKQERKEAAAEITDGTTFKDAPAAPAFNTVAEKPVAANENADISKAPQVKGNTPA